MSLVTLHVYDITNTQYEAANTAIQNLNRFTKDALGAGGIFHGAVEVNGDEWSYGYCDRGTGVYCCRPRGNTGYTYRESIPLGVTSLSPARVRSVIAVLQVQWPGAAYDLLARNCNHFCQAFAEMIGVGPAPAWVNRFAHQADATVNAVTYARDQTRMVVEEIGLAATAATNWLISGFAATEQRDAPAETPAAGGEGAANGGEGAANGGAANGGADKEVAAKEGADEEGAANGGAGGNEETRGRGNDATGTETTSRSAAETSPGTAMAPGTAASRRRWTPRRKGGRSRCATGPTPPRWCSPTA